MATRLILRARLEYQDGKVLLRTARVWVPQEPACALHPLSAHENSFDAPKTVLLARKERPLGRHSGKKLTLVARGCVYLDTAVLQSRVVSENSEKPLGSVTRSRVCLRLSLQRRPGLKCARSSFTTGACDVSTVYEVLSSSQDVEPVAMM